MIGVMIGVDTMIGVGMTCEKEEPHQRWPHLHQRSVESASLNGTMRPHHRSLWILL